MNKEPQVSVGIMHSKEIHFNLRGYFVSAQGLVSGNQIVKWVPGGVEWKGVRYGQLFFIPQGKGTYFTLEDVTIGVQFHWERRENQTFNGSLTFREEANSVVAINQLPVEDYLCSVISSEMSATAGVELLKAHAIISRSWLLAQMQHRSSFTKSKSTEGAMDTSAELVRWQDHDDHTLFDVCADDHCQRYQGITRASNPNVYAAVQSTRGIVMKYDGQICDARFSKCCGGVMEKFSTCWENKDFPYLVEKLDSMNEATVPDLTTEEGARAWIEAEPEAFCNTKDKDVLRQVLNNYDQETNNFFRWKVEYTPEQLSDLIKRRTGMNYGKIKVLEPLHRGTSGRIDRLRIVGSRKKRIIGKELEIRHALSESHLYSSAFVVDQENGKFVLKGAGWGHGVGLCQIGAALMAAKGYKYDAILQHYYPSSELIKDYE